MCYKEKYKKSIVSQFQSFCLFDVKELTFLIIDVNGWRKGD